jgi:hypothetical protein
MAATFATPHTRSRFAPFHLRHGAVGKPHELTVTVVMPDDAGLAP